MWGQDPAPTSDIPRARRLLFAVLRRAAFVLEKNADDAGDLRDRADHEQPPAENDAEHQRGRGGGSDERPPAVRAEETELASALLDLGITTVRRPRPHPPRQEQCVVTDQQAETGRECERRRPRRVLRRE